MQIGCGGFAWVIVQLNSVRDIRKQSNDHGNEEIVKVQEAFENLGNWEEENIEDSSLWI